MDYVWISLISGVLGLIFAVFLIVYIMKQGRGTERMKEISDGIQEGAVAFLRREYSILSIFVVVGGGW
jgi:K(+)-stimulated pyrophosphate-energized sodium pump